MKKTLFLLTAMSAYLIFSAGPGAAETYVTIGSGGVSGVYYPAAGAIAMLVNEAADRYGVRATVDATPGSVYNINAVLKGELAFGVAQSDRQFQAYNGRAEWSEKGPQKDLRAVFSLHPESVTLVALKKSGIDSLDALRGRRVNIGKAGSGQIQNSRDLLEAAGVPLKSLHTEIKAGPEESIGLLGDEKIEAFFYTVGHPNPTVKRVLRTGRATLVPITGDDGASLVESKSYYSKTVIPLGYYDGFDPDAVKESVGVTATLVASSKLDEDIVYAFTRQVFENLEKLKRLHPAFSILTREGMLQGLSAPVHKGALRYYEEAGLLQYLPRDARR